MAPLTSDCHPGHTFLRSSPNLNRIRLGGRGADWRSLPYQRTRLSCLTVLAAWFAAARLVGASFAVELPEGTKVVWDTSRAFREATPTRERICLNGLWRWQPADPGSNDAPAGRWGFFKVPGSWPGITDYMQKDSQRVFAHPDWKEISLPRVNSAWYEREFSIPEGWAGRQVALEVEYLNSYAAVHVNGAKAGELHFPGGRLDLTAVCRPGSSYRLSLLVVALPLKAVMLSYTDSASAREVAGKVARRGLCGDVHLVSSPRGAALTEVNLNTSVRHGELAVQAGMAGLDSTSRYRLHARVRQPDGATSEFTSRLFQTSDLRGGRLAFTNRWTAPWWDLHTPANLCDLELALRDAEGRTLDAYWSQRFGFREFWIDGRDFRLNGSRIHLSALFLDNAQVSAALASYRAARESLERLKSFGINYVYTHNYDCEPGSHLGFSEILRAADDTGMLVGFSQPHFSHYEWKSADADQTNSYARHAAFYARAAGNHPSVVLYVMSHNATGYDEDMNPDLIGGPEVVRDQWARRNADQAARAEAIVRQLDPRRLVYHHASGNLGVMHNSNFYPNFAPVQELDDWFGKWATEGVKPAFTCEYGAPFSWDWTMYRGWYQGQREWGSAKVPWEFCLAEWNAEFLGARAYQISEPEKQNLRWEAKQFRDGKTWHRWDYPNPVGSDRFDERYPIFARYLTNNWRAFRTWGVSGISPWEFEHFWKLRPGVDRSRKEFPVDWENLQRPGFSPDFEDQRYERMDLAYARTDWIATPAAEALLRNNQPLLAYLAGKPDAFTSKDHNFRAGETVEKQIIVINNSRQPVTCDARWSCAAVPGATGRHRVSVGAGEQTRIPIRVALPASIVERRAEIHLTAQFGNGDIQDDRLALDILPKRPAALATSSVSTIALFDPNGETSRWLETIGVNATRVSAENDLSSFETLIIGKGALTTDGASPDIRGVRHGLRVLMFEQTADVLEQRLGFRVQERGLRQVFQCVRPHPALDDVGDEHLRDWRGSATILPPRLKYELRPRYGPTIEWAGLRVPRAWRCSNRGNVASVLIEKPARGDFLPILEGGYALQYSPLLEYREGQGMILFCQLDVTGRTEPDPVAESIAQNLLRYVVAWKPAPQRQAVYLGDPAGKEFLNSLGIETKAFTSELAPTNVLIAGPNVGPSLDSGSAAVGRFLDSGGHLLAIGLEPTDADALLPLKVSLTRREHIASYFEPFTPASSFAGISPADVHNRDPQELFLVTDGITPVGNGVLATRAGSNLVLVQLAPWKFRGPQTNHRRTFRRASVLLNRVLANAGISATTPLLARFAQPVIAASAEKRWLDGFYLDQPEEWDDPYRFFRW